MQETFPRFKKLKKICLSGVVVSQWNRATKDKITLHEKPALNIWP